MLQEVDISTFSQLEKKFLVRYEALLNFSSATLLRFVLNDIALKHFLFKLKLKSVSSYSPY